MILQEKVRNADKCYSFHKQILLLIIVSGNGQVKITPDREKDFFYKFFRKKLALDP